MITKVAAHCTITVALLLALAMSTHAAQEDVWMPMYKSVCGSRDAFVNYFRSIAQQLRERDGCRSEDSFRTVTAERDLYVMERDQYKATLDRARLHFNTIDCDTRLSLSDPVKCLRQLREILR